MVYSTQKSFSFILILVLTFTVVIFGQIQRKNFRSCYNLQGHFQSSLFGHVNNPRIFGYSDADKEGAVWSQMNFVNKKKFMALGPTYQYIKSWKNKPDTYLINVTYFFSLLDASRCNSNLPDLGKKACLNRCDKFQIPKWATLINDVTQREGG